MTEIPSKVCTACGVNKTIDQYHKGKKYNKYGVTAKCKDCRNAYHSKYARRPAVKEAKREYLRAYRKKHPEIYRKSSLKLAKLYPKKHSCRAKLRYHVKVGNIERPDSCEVCHTSCKPHGHHEDYSQPLQVIWVCPACHGAIHRSHT